MTRTATAALLAGLSWAGLAQAQPGDAMQQRSRHELDFAVDLHRRLDAGNTCFSPTSISQALGMLYAGARGQTAAELARVLRFEDGVHGALGRLRQALASRGHGAKAKDGQPFQLHVVNALWGQDGMSLLPDYTALLTRDYDGGLRQLDFAADHEAARGAINGWVAEHTADMIPELLKQGVITPDTRLVLTNAVYFNAAWAEQFEERATQPQPFRLASGERVTVPTMHQTAGFPTASGAGWRLVELPYDGRELAMVVIVPDDLAAFEADLDGAKLAGVLGAQRSWQRLALAIPSWTFRTELDLREQLEALGVKQAFTREADFSGITGGKDLFVSAVIHEAIVDVDEQGTEAAAATAVVMAPTGMPAPPTPFEVDRPFLFLVQDKATGAVVFLGRVADPRG